MITPVADLPARSSLRASHPINLEQTARSAVDNNLQVSFENLFISASFFSGDTVLTEYCTPSLRSRERTRNNRC